MRGLNLETLRSLTDKPANEVTAIGITTVGFVGLTADVESNIIAAIVMLGALIVGFLDVYWLLGEDGAYD